MKELVTAKIVTDSKIVEKVNFFKYLVMNVGIYGGCEVYIKSNRFQKIRGKTEKWLVGKLRRDRIMKFYKIPVVPTLIRGSDGWLLNKRDIRGTEVAEMRFLRSVAGYRLNDKKLNNVIRPELSIIDLNLKSKQRLWKWLQHV